MSAQGGLGALLPADKPYADQYPLGIDRAETLAKPVPVVIGVNWYTAFDRPTRDSDGTWWIGRETANLGTVRGGHAICVRPDSMGDTLGWWSFYDQGQTGECVGFSSSRMMSLLNRARYDAPWLYFAAEERAGQPRDPYSGTYVYAAMDVLRLQGHKTPTGAGPTAGNGISANRWATTVDEIRACLQSPKHDARQGVPLLNSWGRAFPHVVWLPYVTLSRLLNENGEATVVTDR